MIYDFDFRFIIHKSKIITFVSDYKNQNPYFFILNF